MSVRKWPPLTIPYLLAKTDISIGVRKTWKIICVIQPSILKWVMSHNECQYVTPMTYWVSQNISIDVDIYFFLLQMDKNATSVITTDLMHHRKERWSFLLLFEEISIVNVFWWMVKFATCIYLYFLLLYIISFNRFSFTSRNHLVESFQSNRNATTWTNGISNNRLESNNNNNDKIIWLFIKECIQ